MKVYSIPTMHTFHRCGH